MSLLIAREARERVDSTFMAAAAEGSLEQESGKRFAAPEMV
jgi:hypothetical protein